MKRICVFCGSSRGADGAYMECAKALGRELAQRGIGLVYGGARIGLMGAIAASCLECGGSVTGIMPEHLVAMGVANRDITELITVASMHERKSLMNEMSDGFIALPGGIGTMDEMFETITLMQLRLHAKPVGLLNVHAYYDSLLSFLGHMAREKFIRQEHLDMLIVDTDAGRLLDAFANYRHVPEGKWSNPETEPVCK